MTKEGVVWASPGVASWNKKKWTTPYANSLFTTCASEHGMYTNGAVDNLIITRARPANVHNLRWGDHIIGPIWLGIQVKAIWLGVQGNYKSKDIPRYNPVQSLTLARNRSGRITDTHCTENR